MKIVDAFPPNFELIKTALPHADETHTYCYGDTIYVPDGHKLTSDIIFHESFHTTQQGSDPNGWWARFLSDKQFRLDQEAQAYGAQYQWIRQHTQGAKFQKWALESMAMALSGDAYGNLIEYGKAESLIRNYGK